MAVAKRLQGVKEAGLGCGDREEVQARLHKMADMEFDRSLPDSLLDRCEPRIPGRTRRAVGCQHKREMGVPLFVGSGGAVWSMEHL